MTLSESASSGNTSDESDEEWMRRTYSAASPGGTLVCNTNSDAGDPDGDRKESLTTANTTAVPAFRSEVAVACLETRRPPDALSIRKQKPRLTRRGPGQPLAEREVYDIPSRSGVGVTPVSGTRSKKSSRGATGLRYLLTQRRWGDQRGPHRLDHDR